MEILFCCFLVYDNFLFENRTSMLKKEKGHQEKNERKRRPRNGKE
jgi:hypothetical protein